MSLDLKERTECMFGFIMACALGGKNVSPQCSFSPGISTAIYVPTKKINYKFVVKSFLHPKRMILSKIVISVARSPILQLRE